METLEQECRRLRDEIYGIKISDESWNNIKDKWLADLDWLRKQTEKSEVAAG